MVDMLTTVEANTVPASEEDVIRSFNLTPEEQVEVEALQRKLSGPIFKEDPQLEELARTSSNAGVQYLLSKMQGLVPLVVKNEKLYPRMVSSLLAIFTGGKYSDLAALHSFLIHKVVASDANLFKQAWKTNQVSIASSASPASKTYYEGMILADMFRYHPTATSGHVNSMSIATLLFILDYLNNSEDQDLVFILKQMCDEAVEARRDEIKTWIQENMPDYVDLPLPWVVRCIDMYVN